jgi:Co/Zn/Cd efflux system component
VKILKRVAVGLVILLITIAAVIGGVMIASLAFLSDAIDGVAEC